MIYTATPFCPFFRPELLYGLDYDQSVILVRSSLPSVYGQQHDKSANQVMLTSTRHLLRSSLIVVD
jgi:hypothetical protein